MAAEMSIVHNCLIRGINSVYNQCIKVSTRGTDTDKLDFANYAFQWTEMVHEHHSSEDSAIFPSMSEIAGVPGLMDVNTSEHAVFHDKIGQYAEYLKGVVQGKEELDGEKVKTLIDCFMPELHTHLGNEIDTLVALEKYDKVDWDAWFKKEVGKMIKELMGQYEYRVSFLSFAGST
jgi:GTP-binding protein EngB required for normal cell division